MMFCVRVNVSTIRINLECQHIAVREMEQIAGVLNFI